MTRKIPVGDGLGGGGAGAAEGVVAGAAAGDFCAGLPTTAVGQNRGGAKMVAENVEQAVVGGRWVARNAGSDGLVAQSVQATRRLAVGNEQVVEVDLAFGHAEAYFAPSEGRTVCVLVAVDAIDIEFGLVATEDYLDIIPLVGVNGQWAGGADHVAPGAVANNGQIVEGIYASEFVVAVALVTLR